MSWTSSERLMYVQFTSCVYWVTTTISFFLTFYLFIVMKLWFKFNEILYIALFVVSGSIKKLSSIYYVNIYLFSIFFFKKYCLVEKCGVTPHCLYRDSLTLITLSADYFSCSSILVGLIDEHVESTFRSSLFWLI